NYSPASMVTEVLRILCDQKECAIECLYNNTVVDALLQPIHNLMKGTKPSIYTCLVSPGPTNHCSIVTVILLTGAHTIAQFSKKLLDEDISIFSGSEMLPAVTGALISVCRQIYGTCEGLQVLMPYSLHESIAKAWKKHHNALGDMMLFTLAQDDFSSSSSVGHSWFINALITELWANLECGRDDVRVTHPRSTPVDPIDRSCQKSFLALVNLLSYPAVYELVGNQDLPNKAEYSLREVPTCVINIIDRLIILNSEAKIHSLFNYEQSHIFGLRDFIIDGLSVERNHVLVRINVIGGPTERILPPRILEKGDDPYPWPMFSSYPLPNCYLSEVPRNADLKQDNDLGKLLVRFKMSDKQTEWIENCRRQFCKMMKAKPDIIGGGALVELLEKFVLHLSESPSECCFPSVEYTATDANVKNENLSSVQQLGIKMTVRYGKFLNLLKDGAENDLSWVLKHCERFLKQQQAPVKSSLLCLQGSYAGHDWFVSSLFMIMLGNKEKTFRFLQRFSRLLTSAFLWLPRLHIS
ncbi:PREDICTED: protein broad-minded-like, partial [Hipposideros armiger]|uniref:Protein broad-minded-like n=1 Tax=Hipposideros armiger TaxID=186990 RepID=A0A8B7QMZ3_HIPAR